MIDIAVLGLGRIGRVHADNLRRLPGVRVKYLSDPASTALEELADLTGARVSGAEEACDDPEVAGIVIASPTDTHADLVRLAITAGKAVFCEKPISLEFSTARELTEQVEASDASVMLGFQRRYDPDFRIVRDRIADGRSGRLEQLVMHTRDPQPPPISYVEASGGMVRDQAIHDFDQARYMTGEEIISVYAVGNCQIDPAIGEVGDIDSLMVAMLTASGRMVQMSNNRRGPLGYDQRLEAHCAKEVLFIDNRPQNDVRIATETGARSAPPMDYFVSRFEVAYRAEMDAFIEMIRTGAKPLATIRDGLEAQRLAEAAIVSMETGSAVLVSADWQP